MIDLKHRNVLFYSPQSVFCDSHSVFTPSEGVLRAIFQDYRQTKVNEEYASATINADAYR